MTRSVLVDHKHQMTAVWQPKLLPHFPFILFCQIFKGLVCILRRIISLASKDILWQIIFNAKISLLWDQSLILSYIIKLTPTIFTLFKNVWAIYVLYHNDTWGTSHYFSKMFCNPKSLFCLFLLGFQHNIQRQNQIVSKYKFVVWTSPCLIEYLPYYDYCFVNTHKWFGLSSYIARIKVLPRPFCSFSRLCRCKTGHTGLHFF